jgi:signal transduction histidine kinase
MRWPAQTIRLRLTVLYGVVFLVTGGVLLTLGYLLVRHNLNGAANFQAVIQQARKEGILVPGGFFAHGPRPFGNSLFAIIHAQLRAEALHRLLVEYLFALGAMTLVSVVAGWLLAGRALRPLRHITATARRVSGENLGERIALSGPADELKELADTFDGMLVRLEGAFQSQRHFVANASHELRTPLAIMRTEVDVALADPDASEGELRQMGEAIRETIDRCERLIESLLMLARSEAATGHEEAVDLGALAADWITDLRAHAQELHVQVRDDLEPAWTSGDPSLLERLIANLLDNGLRYNERDGFLEVSTVQNAGRVALAVTNSGPRIESDAAATLVEPFRRLDRGSGGFGLGLSIVRSVAEVYGGSVTVRARGEGGLEVRVELPALPPKPGTTPPRKAREALAER